MAYDIHFGSSIVSFIVIIIILILVILNYNKTNDIESKINNIEKNRHVTTNTTSAMSSSVNQLSSALEKAGIIKVNKENFTNTVIFNTYDNINNNYEEFLSIFFPLLSIRIMNETLKTKYNINMTINEFVKYYFNTTELQKKPLYIIKSTTQYKNYMLLVYFMNEKQYFLLGQLYMLLLRKLNDNTYDYFFDEDLNKPEMYIYTSTMPLSKDQLLLHENDEISDNVNNTKPIIKYSLTKAVRKDLFSYHGLPEQDTNDNLIAKSKILDENIVFTNMAIEIVDNLVASLSTKPSMTSGVVNILPMSFPDLTTSSINSGGVNILPMSLTTPSINELPMSFPDLTNQNIFNGVENVLPMMYPGSTTTSINESPMNYPSSSSILN
jgi:hypothetical protein